MIKITYYTCNGSGSYCFCCSQPVFFLRRHSTYSYCRAFQVIKKKYCTVRAALSGLGRQRAKNPIIMERENLVSNLLENLNKLICVDYSRKIFAQDAFETIIALTTRKLVGQDRYRRILLGQKSVGKTTLLDALLKTSQDHFRNLVCVKITYSRLLCDDIGKLPLEYVIDSLGPTWQIWWCFQKLYYRRGRLLSVLENALLANNIFIFGIIDEFNEV